MTLWERVAESIIAHEGGYVNHPNDPGGETNWGISKRSYPHLDMKTLTREQALEIYREDYWDYIPDDLPDGVRWFAFDCAVNHGLRRAIDWLETNHTVAELAHVRLHFYTRLSTWPTFGVGWARRVGNLLKEINDWSVAQNAPLTADIVVFHGIRDTPVILRGNFVWRSRGQKIDIRWVGPIEE